MTVLLALMSVLVGVLIGGAGVGGVLLIPALMFLGGLSTHQAMATALFSFFFTGILATWSYQRHGSMDWPHTIPVCLGSLLSGYLGALVGSYLSGASLNLLLSAIIIGSSIYSMLPPGRLAVAGKLSKRNNFIVLLGVGLFTGFLCGMTGAGGGIVSMPIMLTLGYPALASIATGQVLQSIVSLSGTVSNYTNDFIQFNMVWWVTLCELAGIIAGVRIAHAVPVARLKKGASLVCLGIGVFIAVRAFG